VKYRFAVLQKVRFHWGALCGLKKIPISNFVRVFNLKKICVNLPGEALCEDGSALALLNISTDISEADLTGVICG
jgi:hypothetical protein